jgi:hypothetical protein
MKLLTFLFSIHALACRVLSSCCCPYREIVVQFNADVADGMPWKFVPTQREVLPFTLSLSLSLSLYIYIYTHTHIIFIHLK